MQHTVAGTAQVPARAPRTSRLSDTRLPPLRPATPADLPAIERLLVDAGVRAAGVSHIVHGSADDLTVADDPSAPGELAAVAGLSAHGGSARLRTLAVRHAWRRRGLGEALVRRIVCQADSRGIDAIHLLAMTTEHYLPRPVVERLECGTIPEPVASALAFRDACAR